MTPPATPARPLDALWQARALVWVMLGGEGLALAMAMAPGLVFDRWIYFGLASLWIQWVLLLTIGSLYLVRERVQSGSPLRIAFVALLLAFGWGLLVSWVVRQLGAPGQSGGWWALATQSSAITLTVGLLGIAAFDNYSRGHRHALRAKQAELEALQARIRPHFLFNTLNTATALVHARPGEAERLLLDLSDLFRAALSGPREIPLADELALARRYLEIEALRFGPRLRTAWDLPSPLPAVTLPSLSVQPLVENAIRHGVEPSADGGTIEVSVRTVDGRVRIEVRNDLPPPGADPTPGHQVGLASVRARVAALSGGGGLETRVRDGRYIATITLPQPPG